VHTGGGRGGKREKKKKGGGKERGATTAGRGGPLRGTSRQAGRVRKVGGLNVKGCPIKKTRRLGSDQTRLVQEGVEEEGKGNCEPEDRTWEMNERRMRQ